MSGHEHPLDWTPRECPRCTGHRLRVTRVRCEDCGLELSGDCALCSCDDDPRDDAPSDDTKDRAADAGESPHADEGASARDQILARVASGQLTPALAADLLARLRG